MNRISRAGLAFLAASQLVIGLFALFLPRLFFAIPVVGMGMAYNPHFVLDYGAMSLATALPLLAAVFRPRLARIALLAYLAFAIPHFVIHLRFIDCVSPSLSVWLLLALGLAILLPLGLLVLTRSSSAE